MRAIRAEVDELWGVEPDTSVDPGHGLLTHFRQGLMQTADLPEDYFDVAYSFFVMEHVEEPVQFLKAVSRVLKPGGSYFFMTPNARHYFVLAARLMKTLRIDEWYLRRARGQECVEKHHYPVVYRINSESVIRKAAGEAGLTPRGFIYTERRVSRDYFWGPSVVLHWLAHQKRCICRDPRCLLELTCCLDKI